MCSQFLQIDLGESNLKAKLQIDFGESNVKAEEAEVWVDKSNTIVIARFATWLPGLFAHCFPLKGNACRY